jgi:regulator of RNase E activity RraA
MEDSATDLTDDETHKVLTAVSEGGASTHTEWRHERDRQLTRESANSGCGNILRKLATAPSGTKQLEQSWYRLYWIGTAKAGEIVVIDAGANVQTAVVGEHLCGAARRRGVAGLIANGAVRDIAALAAWSDFPVFALGHTARGPVSFDRGTVNDSIVCGGVPIRPRDLVLGDDDGLIVIPRDEAEQWLAKAREKVALEQEWDRRLSAGESMLRVFGISEP